MSDQDTDESHAEPHHAFERAQEAERRRYSPGGRQLMTRSGTLAAMLTAAALGTGDNAGRRGQFTIQPGTKTGPDVEAMKLAFAGEWRSQRSRHQRSGRADAKKRVRAKMAKASRKRNRR